MNDVITLLADANPVRVEDVVATRMPVVMSRTTMPRRRLVPAVAVAIVASGAVAAIAVFGGPGSVPRTPLTTTEMSRGGLAWPPGPASGLRFFGPDGTVSLAQAAAALGAPVVLPETDSVTRSDVGTVLLYTNEAGPTTWGGVEVLVEFPSKGFWVTYERTMPETQYDNTLREYERQASSDPSELSLVLMNGMPALVRRGSVELVAGGTTVRVEGYNPATLSSVAESIADRSDSPPAGQLGNIDSVQVYPYVPPATRVRLSDLSQTLGAPVALPDTTLVQPSDAGEAWAGGMCPHTDDSAYWVTPEQSHPCWLWISFPGTSLSVGYVRPPVYKEDKAALSLYASRGIGEVIELSRHGAFRPIPALVVPADGRFPGWAEFDFEGSRIVVGGNYDAATLQAVAQSIVDGFHSR